MMPLMTSRLQNKILNYCINFCTNSFPMTVGTWVCTYTMDEGGEVWMHYWPKWAFGWVLNAKVQKYKLYLESLTLGFETFLEGTSCFPNFLKCSIKEDLICRNMIKSLPFVYNAKKVHYSSFDMFQERAFHHKVPGNRVASKVSEKQPLIRTFSNILASIAFNMKC